MLDRWLGGYAVLVEGAALRVTRTPRRGSPATRWLMSWTRDGGTDGTDLPWQALDQWLIDDGVRGRTLQVQVGGDAVRHWRMPVPTGASSPDDVRGAAAMAFERLYGEPTDTWHMAVDLQGPSWAFACAVPQRLYVALNAMAHQRGLVLVSLQSELMTLWNRWCHRLDSRTWLGICKADHVWVATSDGRNLTGWRCWRPASGRVSDAEQVLQWLERESALQGLAMPSDLAVLGDMPGAWRALGPRLHCEPLSRSGSGFGVEEVPS